MASCKTCGGSVSRKSTTGNCRRCANAVMNACPENQAKRKAAMKRRIQTDPLRLEQLRKSLAEARKARKPVSVEHMRALGAKGRAAKTAESHARTGRNVSATKLAWCPTHLRAEYRNLTARGFPASEARSIIEAQNEMEMARWRRSIGVVTDDVTAITVTLLRRAMTPFERAMATAASVFDITEEQILSPDRSRHISVARYALAATLHRSGMSTPKIAASLNRSDHTSAIHWLKRADWFGRNDAKFAQQMQHVMAAWSDEQRAAA